MAGPRVIRCLTALLAGFALAALPLLSAAAPVPGQKKEDPAKVRLERGREALEAGRFEEAVAHLERALVFEPFSSEILGLLLEATANDPDARASWGGAWWRAVADDRGRATGGRALAATVADLVPSIEGVEIARASAVAELAKLSSSARKRGRKAPASGLVAWWAANLGRELGRRNPALLAAHEEDLGLDLSVTGRLPDQVITSIQRAHSLSQSGGRYAEAVRAARILRGLAVQGGFKDLKGPRPSGIDALRRDADEMLSRSRARLFGVIGEPLTVEMLEELDEPEAREFTQAHDDLSNPGVAVSPRGWYRIETCCGWETLLGVADTIELHHQRLVNWFGRDPFEDRPGLVRVLPEAAGLESEGAPFWWAGGFQGGDTTVMRFSCGTIEGLGHGLTHELTHRFDGAIYPGMPSWLAEGKAVFTGGAYGHSTDEEFVEDHISFGTVESAWMKGYGGEKKLQELIESEIEDYRDNYIAGYALYVYLKLWEEGGRQLYAGKLEPYMQGLKSHGKDPLAWFEQNFADGKEGRPDGFEAFAGAFHEFVRGFYWDDRAEWTSRYQSSVPQSGDGFVYDEPTWTWSRHRAEPYWGQDHAWRAGDLLLDLGKKKDAVNAYLWALSVDERSPWRNSKLARLLEVVGEEDAAWVLRNELERRFRRAGDALSEGLVTPLRLPRTRDLLGALAEQADALAAADLPRTRAAVVADHNRLARWIGAELPDVPAHPEPEVPLHPFDEARQRLGVRGWAEDDLTGYEERRAKDCWYVEEDGDLHVGRFRPRDATGQLDRSGHNRHAFTATEAGELPGRYRVRCRIQFTTSYVSGALILGYTRRDRNVRVGFTAGDFYYSIGKKDQPEVLERVGWRISGLRDRDGALPGSLRGGSVEFDEPRTNFGLEVVVDGAAVHVWIEGQHVGTYHTVDGEAVRGRIGFATSFGAMRVIDPTVQRLDRGFEAGHRLPADRYDGLIEPGLDLHDPPELWFNQLVNKPVLGLRPHLAGTLLAWVPLPEHPEEEREYELERCATKASRMAEQAAQMLIDVDAGQAIALAVPDALGEERIAALRAELVGRYPGEATVVAYPWRGEVSEDLEAMPAAMRSWLCFVDSAGILRHAERFYSFTDRLPEGLDHWITVFRDHDGEH